METPPPRILAQTQASLAQIRSSLAESRHRNHPHVRSLVFVLKTVEAAILFGHLADLELACRLLDNRYTYGIDEDPPD